MIRNRVDQSPTARPHNLLWSSVRQRVAGAKPPRWPWLHLGPRGRLVLAWAGIIVGLMVQLVLLWLLGEIIDLAISLMELWAELARKHLELTLDTTV